MYLGSVVQKWNSYLASMAADWADRCDWNHGQPDRDPDTVPFDPIGQNLYLTSAQSIDLSSGIQDWYDEKSVYDFDTGACSGVCGHYTQVRLATFTSILCTGTPSNVHVYTMHRYAQQRSRVYYAHVRPALFMCVLYTGTPSNVHVCTTHRYAQQRSRVYYAQVRPALFMCVLYTGTPSNVHVCTIHRYAQHRSCVYYTQVRPATFMCVLYTATPSNVHVCTIHSYAQQRSCVYYTQVRPATFTCILCTGTPNSIREYEYNRLFLLYLQCFVAFLCLLIFYNELILTVIIVCNFVLILLLGY